MFGQPGKDGSLWGPILEKAAAKLYGNYEALQGGWMGPAMQMLTGAPYYEKYTSDFRSVDNLWSYIDEKLSNGWLVAASSYPGSNQDNNELGVPYGHAFSVLSTVIVGDDDTKLIKIRNPWGEETFNGPWSDESELWNDELKKLMEKN